MSKKNYRYRAIIRDTGTVASEFNVFKFEVIIERKRWFGWDYATSNWAATERDALRFVGAWLGRPVPDQFPLVFPNSKEYRIG